MLAALASDKGTDKPVIGELRSKLRMDLASLEAQLVWARACLGCGCCACTVRSSLLCVATLHVTTCTRSTTRMKATTLKNTISRCVSGAGLLLKVRARISRYRTATQEKSVENVKLLKAGNTHLLIPRLHSGLRSSRSCEVVCLLELTSKQIGTAVLSS